MAVSRESQIDAIELDSECYQLFQSQINQSLTHLPINILKKIEPEISALLNLAVYVVPLYTSSSLVSHELLGIQFSKKTNGSYIPKKWYIYSFTLVGINWISNRWNTISGTILNENTASQFLNWLHISAKILNLLNSLVFLKQGVYPTILHRVLQLKTELVNPNEPKSADLSTLTRELLWHSFSEMLMFALPLVNVHRAKSWLTRLIKLKDDNPSITVRRNTLCAVCNETPIIPQETQCQHVFCYYCLKANLEAVSEYTCPLCSFLIVADDGRKEED
ncbi:peroxisome biogenesis factor 2-like isoform X2 [Daphnia pulicaria]|uniref:peroxisome biogenesis factor 2-like isoform X2 n=1 Tax=Daphnia pulicaria TaxID=35523 RepID=UPI001EE9D78B|nr:peroxisome biogenesis factor 2-like isoform X2 [Daphnia pulicaria]